MLDKSADASKTVEIFSSQELDQREKQIHQAAEKTAKKLRLLINQISGAKLLAELKFRKTGHDPLHHSPLNLIEQLNQTFTYLTTIEAAKWLFNEYPKLRGVRLNLGTRGGSDIESLDGEIAAEVFSAVHTGSNRKLVKDIKKVSLSKAANKYVFYFCPDDRKGRRTDKGVSVVPLQMNI